MKPLASMRTRLTMRKVRRIALHALVGVLIVAGSLALAGVLIVRSGWFRERVRTGIISAVEDATGGRVELGAFRFDWRHLVASVRPFVLHGTEGPGEPPLVRAESITVGLRVLSFLERRIDLAYLRVDQPQAYFAFYPNGTDNFPVPPHPTAFWADQFVDLAARRFEVNHGLVEYDGRDVPIDMRAEDLHILMSFDNKIKGYRGEVTSKHLRMVGGGMEPVEFDTDAQVTFEKSGVDIQRLRLATRRSRFDFSGKLDDFRAMHGTFRTKASIAASDAVSVFSLPLAPVGNATFDGDVMLNFATGFDYSIAGRVVAKGLGYTYQRTAIKDAEVQANLRAVPDQITLERVTAKALDSTLTGRASLLHGRDLHIEGNIDGPSLRDAVAMATAQPFPWTGRLAGSFTADAVLGEQQARVQAAATITPPADGPGIEGRINIDYDQRLNAVRLSNSYVATPTTRVELDGSLGDTVQVRARSSNLRDLAPALALAIEQPPSIPVTLASNGGLATLEGVVNGPLDDPRFSGQLHVTNAAVEGHGFDSFSGDIDASRRNVTVRGFTLSRGSNPADATTVTGEVNIALREGNFEASAIRAGLNFRDAQIGPLRDEFKKELPGLPPLSGTVSGTANLSGTIGQPVADASLQVEKPAAFDEQFDRVRASVHYDATALRLASGELDAGTGKLLFQGSFAHRDGDWDDGSAHFDVSAQNFATSRVAAIAKLKSGLEGIVSGRAAGDAQLRRGRWSLSAVNTNLTASKITLNQDPLGDLALTTQTHGTDLDVETTAHIRQSTIQGQGRWRMDGDYAGTATLKIPRVTIAALRDLAMLGSPAQEKLAEPPFEGFLEGTVNIQASLENLAGFRAEIRIDTLQFNPKATQTVQLGVPAQDLVLRNSGPIVISATAKEARIQSARFTARGTNLEAAGAVPFTSTGGADLSVQGSVNLVILQLLNPNLLARGDATLQTSVRGSLRDPLVNGRMELKNASLYMNDVPNGLDNVNGIVFFDRNRATIDRLNAETGGGTLAMSGFVEFGSTLVYRLQASAQQVRVRYPEDVSVTATAQLALSGTSDASTISGSVTLTRAALNPHADLGRLIAESAKPSPTPESPSDYLRGMRFDVRIQSSPVFELETALTRDVQAEVDLRLRGTPLRPVLLGSVSVNAGEIQLFGNNYTVNRGNIRFQNAVRIEPIFDVNLETKARGVIVSISLSGTTQKLNVNYSSDPPLQTRDIIALLAVGRGPTQNTVTESTALSADSTSFVEAGGGLLGQAVADQLSSRLQRFFGASRVKIDPLLTGVENIPEARLTFEQQVSRDVTLTYITNLNRTQEQIVQVEWDVSRQWSASAVRDSNGLFGIDFTFRKRFK